MAWLGAPLRDPVRTPVRGVSYLPALDGLRGVAVGAVLLFHGGFSVARGGFLGVTTFFVLSGFLITRLLLAERERTGRIDLAAFWLRRARRLVPATLVLIALVIGYVVVVDGAVAAGTVGDGFAAALWAANWRFILEDHSYAEMFGAPSPFEHMWSLAVEEQFYLVLPVVAAVALGRRGAPRRARFALVVATGVLASVVAGVLLTGSEATSGRVYFGTDTRAAEPLLGVLLAVALFRLRRVPGFLAARALDLAAVAALGGLAVMVVGVSKTSPFLGDGGFLLAAALSAVVIAAAAQPTTWVSRVLAMPPLTALGRISYGAYLYHWPVFLLLSHARTGWAPWPLFAVRCVLTLALATLSYFLVELPIRTRTFSVRVWLAGWANAGVGLLSGLTLAASPMPTATVDMFSTAFEEAPPLPEAPAPPATTSTVAASTYTRASSPSSTPTAATTPRRANEPARTDALGMRAPTRPPPAPPAPPPGPPPLKIAVVGDSMAVGIAEGLTEWAKQRTDVLVYGLAIPGCPVSVGGARRMPDGRDWPIEAVCSWWTDPTSERSKRLHAFDPDVILMHDALNNVPDRKIDAWPIYQRPGESRFDMWLLEQYRRAASTFEETGATVVALDAVCVDWDRLGGSWTHYGTYSDGNYRLAAIDRVTSALADHQRRVLELSAQLCPGGTFTQRVAGVDDARPDGYHLSDEAAIALAEQWLGPRVLEAAKSAGTAPVP